MTETDIPEQNIMRRIQALLERAGHAATPEAERESCTAKADALMAKYRIERAMLNFSHEAKQREIQHAEVPTPRNGQYDGYLLSMMYAIFEHAGCKAKNGWDIITIVGYEEDIYYAEMLWATVHMDFIAKMFPKWESSRSFDANVFEIKNAGYGWPEVREMGLAKDAGDGHGKLTEKNAGSKLRSAFKREAARRGIQVLPGRQQPANPKLFRDSYVQAYDQILRKRIRDMASANEVPGEYAVAVQSDADRILAEFYRLFPEAHPDAVRRRQEAAEAARLKRLREMTPEEKREAEKAAKAWERMISKKPRTRFADMRGWEAGTKAAARVNLSGDRNNVGNGRAGELG